MIALVVLLAICGKQNEDASCILFSPSRLSWLALLSQQRHVFAGFLLRRVFACVCDFFVGFFLLDFFCFLFLFLFLFVVWFFRCRCARTTPKR